MNKQDIIALLKTNDKAVARALVALNERQTDSEQASEETRFRNGQGFRPCNARMGTSMANFYQKRGYLTAKQLAYWRMPNKEGKMRIEVYANQLLQIAMSKAAAKPVVKYDKTREELAVEPTGPMVVAVPVNPYVGQDLGNLMEEQMVLQEQYSDLLESDNEEIYGPIKQKLDLINAAIKQGMEQDERDMQRREAEGDRAQTGIDELNKFVARCRMERK